FFIIKAIEITDSVLTQWFLSTGIFSYYFCVYGRLSPQAIVLVLTGFLGGAGAVPPLAIVWVGLMIPTRAQQKWLGSKPVIGCNNNHMGGMLYVTMQYSSTLGATGVDPGMVTSIEGLPEYFSNKKYGASLTTIWLAIGLENLRGRPIAMADDFWRGRSSNSTSIG
uniref:Uncharacterized protein n=1 Tax=Romanomermis culicivorax TaxID=13658 RepID=A0A915II65_ROMCU